MTSEAEIQELEQALFAARKMVAVKQARESLKAFISWMMPHPDHPDDPARTLYDETPQGDFLCRVIEDAAKGLRKRTGVSVPPQHGKTMHLSIMGLAWLLGVLPEKRFIVATYNEIRASELGEEVKSIIESQRYQQVFPHVILRADSKSKTAMRITKGGRLVFVGRGGTITGRGADFFIIDDPLKDDEEAGSDSIREKLWTWFFSVAYSRGSNKTVMIVLHTRWHEDDLLGRLCDAEHPERNGRFKSISDDWTYLNLPAVVTDPDMAAEIGLKLERPQSPAVIEQFGDRPMSALWERERNLEFLAQWRRGDARTFDALAMGKPSPDDGTYFLAENIVTYERHELPSNLRMYGASDHAVSERARRDYNVVGCAGVDHRNDVWVMPDLVIRRMETDKVVDEIIAQILRHRPSYWFMESEHISKSFGPFLKEQMRLQSAFTTLSPMRPSADKETRARSIQGRVALQTVRFPRFAPWWQSARSQMLRFPNAANDDFVDWLSWIGLGISKLVGPGRANKPANQTATTGSIQWILNMTEERAANDVRKAANSGW